MDNLTTGTLQATAFGQVPDWLLDAEVSDRAIRLYATISRYGNTSGSRMPGRALLARRMGCSVDSVDRAVVELESAGALTVTRDDLPAKGSGVMRAPNRYRLWSDNLAAPAPIPSSVGADTPSRIQDDTPSRNGAALPKGSTYPATTVPPSAAQTLIGGWIDQHETRPPGRVVGQVAKLVGELLSEGQAPAHIAAGLSDLRAKGLNPSVLPSLVNETANPPTRHRGDEKLAVLARGLALAKEAEANGVSLFGGPRTIRRIEKERT